MCDDVHATVAELKAKGAEFTRPVSDEGFGLMTALRLPGGGELGLYEPRHPTPLSRRPVDIVTLGGRLTRWAGQRSERSLPLVRRPGPPSSLRGAASR